MSNNTGKDKRKRISLKEFDRLLDTLDIQPILNSRVRQVRWLYNNSNKCTTVYDEKLVRLIVHRLSQRISELQSQLIATDFNNGL